jgi:hypothetical protein
VGGGGAAASAWGLSSGSASAASSCRGCAGRPWGQSRRSCAAVCNLARPNRQLRHGLRRGRQCSAHLTAQRRVTGRGRGRPRRPRRQATGAAAHNRRGRRPSAAAPAARHRLRQTAARGPRVRQRGLWKALSPFGPVGGKRRKAYASEQSCVKRSADKARARTSCHVTSCHERAAHLLDIQLSAAPASVSSAGGLAAPSKEPRRRRRGGGACRRGQAGGGVAPA